MIDLLKAKMNYWKTWMFVFLIVAIACILAWILLEEKSNTLTPLLGIITFAFIICACKFDQKYRKYVTNLNK